MKMATEKLKIKYKAQK